MLFFFFTPEERDRHKPRFEKNVPTQTLMDGGAR